MNLNWVFYIPYNDIKTLYKWNSSLISDFLNQLTAINESRQVEGASWPKRQLAPAYKGILWCDILNCLHTCHNNMDSKNGKLVYQVSLIVFFEKLPNIVLIY